MKEKKHMKQSRIGNFFQKAKEPSLWTAVSNEPPKKKDQSSSLRKKIHSGKAISKLDGTASQKKCRSHSSSQESNDNVILKTPETVPKWKSSINQKSKLGVPFEKNKDGKNKTIAQINDSIFIDKNTKETVDNNTRKMTPFSSVKNKAFKGVNAKVPCDTMCIISDDEDGEKNPPARKDLPCLRTKNRDVFEDNNTCGRSFGIFTKIRPNNSMNKESFLTDDVNKDCHLVSRKSGKYVDDSQQIESVGLSGFSNDIKRQKPHSTRKQSETDLNNKTSRLKLKRLDSKRIFRFGSSGVSPMKKRQAKDGDVTNLKNKDTNSATKGPNNVNSNTIAGKNESKYFGKRCLFTDESYIANDNKENLHADETEVHELDLNQHPLLGAENNHSEADDRPLMNAKRYNCEAGFDDGDDDIISQYAQLIKKDDRLKLHDRDKLQIETTNSAEYETNRSMQSEKNHSFATELDQYKEKGDHLDNIGDISLTDFNDSFQISNIFEDVYVETTKRDTCCSIRSKEKASGESKKIDQLHQSLLDITFDDDFDVPSIITETDTTVKSVLVLEVNRQEYHDSSDGVQAEKIVRLFDEETSSEAVCHLRQDWETMEIFPGDSVYITGFSSSQQSTVTLDNDSTEFLTLFPNTLVSGTTISMGITCQRRGVLSELFKTDGPNKAMFLGTFLHELFDFAISKKVFNVTALTKKACTLLQKHDNLNTLHSLGVQEADFMENVREYTALLSKWGQRFLKDSPQTTDEIIDFKLGSEVSSDDITRLSISDIVDIEENILCPSLGLKGKVDASVNVTVHREPKVQRRNGTKIKNAKYHIPFELKTGKMFSKLGSIEHRAQVILYTLMMSEKYHKKIEAGLLYYIKAGHLQGVPATQKEKRALIMKRNEIVRYLSMDNLRNKKLMPGLLKDQHSCKRCPVVTNCMVYHKTIEEGTVETSGVYQQFDDLTGHLTKEEASYFFEWYHLIMLEAQEEASSSNHKKLWIESSDKRQSAGCCFSQMSLKSEVDRGDKMKFYTFERKKSDDNCNRNFKEYLICAGDRVIISEENCKTFGLTTGLVKSLTEDDVCILCTEKIKTRSNITTTLFRIERDESLTSYKIPLGNLMKLFSSQTEHDKKIRKLIVSLSAPRFSWFDSKSLFSSDDNRKQALVYSNDEKGQSNLITKSQQKEIRSVVSGLNPSQKQAVEKCLSAQDYVMILGMPGTGKTTTIACIVKTLVTLGKTVLITSYTHSAVDNILLKINEMNLDFLRLGQTQKIHPEVQPYSVEMATASIKTVDGLARFYDSKKIVATTCLGINHALFLKKRFDYCIVDEASQITQPVCLGAIRCADVFVLVGDHYQLPPLVQSMEAKNGGMDVSLFKRLSEHHPSAVISLQHQYRMHRDIMALANVLIYDHRMECGTKVIETKLLEIPKLHRLQQKLQLTKSQGKFLSSALEPRQPVVFIDTDAATLLESQTDNHISNESEANLVACLFQELVTGGVESKEIGIISPYRHQLKVIKDAVVQKYPNVDLNDVEINTVDKYQGRDKSCIIVSFVRSNSSGNIGNLLKDWRRINVALTRAKQKLIMIGSRRTLSSSPVLKKLMDFTDENDWIIRTPDDILELINV